MAVFIYTAQWALLILSAVQAGSPGSFLAQRCRPFPHMPPRGEPSVLTKYTDLKVRHAHPEWLCFYFTPKQGPISTRPHESQLPATPSLLSWPPTKGCQDCFTHPDHAPEEPNDSLLSKSLRGPGRDWGLSKKCPISFCLHTYCEPKPLVTVPGSNFVFFPVKIIGLSVAIFSRINVSKICSYPLRFGVFAIPVPQRSSLLSANSSHVIYSKLWNKLPF